MDDYKEVMLRSDEHLPPLAEATPPLSPASMPSQAIAFWTPRAVVSATMQAMLELYRPQRARQPAIAMTMPNADEPR